MRIVFDMNEQPWIHVDNEDMAMPLPEFAKYIREKHGYTVARMEREAGLEHPRWYNMERGTFSSLKTLLIGLEFLGYGLRIDEKQ